MTSILQDADGLHLAVDSLIRMLDGLDYDVVVGPESRGFIFGVPVAYAQHKSFVPVQQKGKTSLRDHFRDYDLSTARPPLRFTRMPLSRARRW